MSGSSLDGLDLALSEFWLDSEGRWMGKIHKSETRPFPGALFNQLKSLPFGSAADLAQADFAFSAFSAGCVADFLSGVEKMPLFIASHGHTVFHQPQRGFTCQIGNGGILAAKSGLPVVCDFRSTDVGLGGQGAPLVPGAEHFLFAGYSACLNLGGIANLSFPNQPARAGFDVAPCNQLLNHAAAWRGLDYDRDGNLAKAGNPIPELMNQLQAIPFYCQHPPKSLGNEDVRHQWIPLLEPFKGEPENVLSSLCKHIAGQIGAALSENSGKILVTGGGAFHHTLLKSIEENLDSGLQIELPSSEMIGFKEAYCFAFLGLKRWLGEVNCFARHTGASRDGILGCIYF